MRELEANTGVPDLATPCVCGGGTGLSSSGLSKHEIEGKHSAYCIRFMSACRTKGISSNEYTRGYAQRSPEILIQFVSV